LAGSTRTPAIGTRPAAWTLGAVVVALVVQLAAAPQIGLPLTALALIIAVAIVAVLALTELERDVVHMAVIGAVLGGLVECWLIDRSAWLHGALFGVVVGALVGDEIQVARKWLRLTRQAKEERRWWQRVPVQSRWLPLAVWIGFAAMLAGCAVLAVYLRPRLAEQTAMLEEWFAAIRARRLEASTWSNIVNAWFAIVVLAMSIALSRFVSRVPNQQLLVDGLLRRIAVLQCAAFLMLALDGALRMLTIVLEIDLSPPILAFADTLRYAMIPVFMLLIAQFFLGKRLAQYWRQAGWIVALSLSAMLGVCALQICAAYVMAADRLAVVVVAERLLLGSSGADIDEGAAAGAQPPGPTTIDCG
jgi:hypothetical protein